MAEYLRRVDLVHPSTGEQRTHNWVVLLEAPTLAGVQVAANAYLLAIASEAVTIVRPFLMSSAYTYIPLVLGPPMDERHVITLTFATVGEIDFIVPAPA